MKNRFDLKGFRENELKISQERLAKLLGTKQDTVSRMERNPSQISLDMMVRIAEKTGQTLDQLIGYRKPDFEPLEPEPKYEDLDMDMKYLEGELQKGYSALPEGMDLDRYVSPIRGIIKAGVRKPVIGVIGKADSGKSTLINKLLGGNILPTGWLPKTSINVFIKHIDDRPEYMDDQVWVFGKKYEDDRPYMEGKGRNEDKGERWDPARLYDEEYCRKWKLAGGTAEMLASFGTYDGAGYRRHDVDAAIMFLDAPILKNVDILDTPGFTGAVERDVMLARTASGHIDALVYMSKANVNGFMSAEDIEFLKLIFPQLGCVEGMDAGLGPLANIYVLASQAYMMNRDEVDDLLDKGCSRFCTAVTDAFWKGRAEAYKARRGEEHDYTEKDLRGRCFPYSVDTPELYGDFEEDLKHLTETLPSIIKGLTIEEMISECDRGLEKLDGMVKLYKVYVTAKNPVPDGKALAEQKANEHRQKTEIRKRRNDVASAIKQARWSSIENFEKAYGEIINVDAVKEIIKRKEKELNQKSKKTGLKVKEQDRRDLVLSYINTLLHHAYSSTLAKEAKPVVEKINLFEEALVNGENTGRILPNTDNAVGTEVLGFRMGRALAAATVATVGNALRATDMLSISDPSAIPIHEPGPMTGVFLATTLAGIAVSPISFGIGFPILAAAAGWLGFRSGWEDKAARQICEQFEKQDALGTYNKNTDLLWSRWYDAFNREADHAEAEAERHVPGLHAEIGSEAKQGGEKSGDLEKAKEFFGNMKHLAEMFKNDADAQKA